MTENNKLNISKPFYNYIFIFMTAIIIIVIIYFSLLIGLKDNSISRLFKGSDFQLFTNGSNLILNGNKDKLYDIEYYKKLILDKGTEKVYRPHYTPILYYFYIPFSSIPLFWGIFLSTLLFILLYCISVLIIIYTFRRLNNLKYLIILISMFFPPFFYAILNGHPSVLWIFLLTLGFFFSKKGNPFISGMILSLLILKPNFYLLIFIIFLFSLQPRLLFGLITGSIIFIFISGIWDGFYLWQQWFNVFINMASNFFDKTTMIHFGQYSKRVFFYPIFSSNKIIIIINYIFVLVGLLAVILPCIYSYINKKQFSRNSFWFIFSISLALASPYLYNVDLIVLFLPFVILVNLMLADRVLNKYIIIMLISFCVCVISCFLINIFFHIQLFVPILWFFLINGTLSKRIRNYTPKTFIQYWEDY
jgi:hypothetical protein